MRSATIPLVALRMRSVYTGYNSAYNNKLYNDSDSEIAGSVRDMRLLPQNFNIDKNTLDSIIFSVKPRLIPLLFHSSFLVLSIVYHSNLHTIICTPPLVCFSNNNNNNNNTGYMH